MRLSSSEGGDPYKDVESIEAIETTNGEFRDGKEAGNTVTWTREELPLNMNSLEGDQKNLVNVKPQFGGASPTIEVVQVRH